MLLDQELKDVSQHLHVGEPTVELVDGVAVVTWVNMAITQISSRIVTGTQGGGRVKIKATQLQAKRGSSIWCATPCACTAHAHAHAHTHAHTRTRTRARAHSCCNLRACYAL